MLPPRTMFVRCFCLALAACCLIHAAHVARVAAQTSARTDGRAAQTRTTSEHAGTTIAPAPALQGASAPDKRQTLRLERLPVAGGAELLTIFATGASGITPSEASPTSAQTSAASAPDVPLVSVLRDTLGDDDPANDVLRDVWMHTYAAPSMRQRALAAVPFLYTNRLSRTDARRKGVPPRLIDLAHADRDVWDRLIWTTLQFLLVNPQGFAVRAPFDSYRRNLTDYRKAHLIRALAVLSLYEMTRREDEERREQLDAGIDRTAPALSDVEMSEIGGRLALAEAQFGGIIDDANLQRVYARQTASTSDTRGHNWELLRQQAERDNLYFEPLLMPDGSATHALLWIAEDDLEPYRSREWHGRFLNIADPWRDRRLRSWQGYAETWSFDADGRRVAETSGGGVARTRRMIPLALYGLDHPKIPVLLVDFRDRLNPKRREVSRRVLRDVVRNVLQVGRFGSIYYFLGRTVYDYTTNRRGADINQPSRLRAYSELKLLLSLDASLDPELRDEIAARSGTLSLNPVDASASSEATLARNQYSALVRYARDPAGLPARLARDRRSEAHAVGSSDADRALHRLARVASLGIYNPRPAWTPERAAQIDTARRVRYHTRFLREVAASSAVVEVRWNVDDVRRSLEFLAANPALAEGQGVKAVGKIFRSTADDETRALAMRCLYRIDRPEAKRLLLGIESDAALPDRWREMSRDLLRTALQEEQRFSSADLARAQTIVGAQTPKLAPAPTLAP